MLIMENMAEPDNIDGSSEDSRDCIPDLSDDEVLSREREKFFSEFIEEVDEAKANLPPIPKLRIKITKHPTKKRKKPSTPIDDSQLRHSDRVSKQRVSYEILDDIFIDEDFMELPLPPVIHQKSGPKSQSQGQKTHYPRGRYGVKNTPREVVFNPDALPGTICYNSQKVYDQSGTTCHQCRQKTIDLKSRCYSQYCHGVRGQFCGYCLLQRYGEDVAVVLRDPNWKCPPCRRICNCSICRRSHGKPPTGQLYQFAIKNGFRNVTEYLAQLGDDKLEDIANGDQDNEENLPPQENNKVRSEDHQPPDEDNLPIRIKQEPIDHEDFDFENVTIKEEPVDYEFEGTNEEDQVDYGYGEANQNEQEDTQQTCGDMIEFEPINIKLERPDSYEANVAVNSES